MTQYTDPRSALSTPDNWRARAWTLIRGVSVLVRRASHFDTCPRGSMPAGGVISTAEDMSRYLAMYLAGGRYKGKVLPSAAGVAQMLQPGFPAGQRPDSDGDVQGELARQEVLTS